MTIRPSGTQFEITAGDNRVSIVEVGGGIRSFLAGGRPVLDGYDVDERCTGARGLPLIPWPNRLADGAYTFDGTDHQVPLTEPDKHNAIHGFLRWRSWTAREHTTNRVVMGTVLHPMMGYPFTLDVTVAYTLGEEGLTVHTTATNLGEQPCPYGGGQHPYLTLGTELIDPCTLQLDAGQWLPTNDRGLPTGAEPVNGSPYDFRAARGIGHQDVDYTFTDLARDANGLAWVRMSAPDGRHADVWLDESYPFVEIYTAHTQPKPYWRRGLGVEPMTCAPNAFVSGDGLIRLEPGHTASSRWGLHPG